MRVCWGRGIGGRRWRRSRRRGSLCFGGSRHVWETRNMGAVSKSLDSPSQSHVPVHCMLVPCVVIMVLYTSRCLASFLSSHLHRIPRSKRPACHTTPSACYTRPQPTSLCYSRSISSYREWRRGSFVQPIPHIPTPSAFCKVPTTSSPPSLLPRILDFILPPLFTADYSAQNQPPQPFLPSSSP